MKKNFSLLLIGRKAVFLLLGIASLTVTVQAQAVIPNDKPPPPPSQEQFKPASDLITPWRNQLCSFKKVRDDGRRCFRATREEEKKVSSNLTIYRSNGTVWYRFGLFGGQPDYYLGQNKNDSFKPFTSNLVSNPNVLLRLTAESDNWFKVEINEDTRETRYILKSDPLWMKTNWETWLTYWGGPIYPAREQEPLRDKPDGNVIEEFAPVAYQSYRFFKAEGDWMYVEGVNLTLSQIYGKYKGWIRWREGRKILVGCYFNNYDRADQEQAVGEKR
jgi:hypothetical protein